MAAPKSKRTPAKANPKRVSIKVQKAKFKKFLMNNAEYSLLGHWRVPHSVFVLYSVRSGKCTVPWFTFRWNRDEATPFKCGETPIVRAFFNH